jgi:hypothetical protein
VVFELWSERPNALAKKRLVLLGKGSVKNGMENLGQSTGLSIERRFFITKSCAGSTWTQSTRNLTFLTEMIS